MLNGLRFACRLLRLHWGDGLVSQLMRISVDMPISWLISFQFMELLQEACLVCRRVHAAHGALVCTVDPNGESFQSCAMHMPSVSVERCASLPSSM